MIEPSDRELLEAVRRVNKDEPVQPSLVSAAIREELVELTVAGPQVLALTRDGHEALRWFGVGYVMGEDAAKAVVRS